MLRDKKVAIDQHENVASDGQSYEVGLVSCEDPDQVFRLLRSIPEIDYLSIERTRLQDSHFHDIARMRSLRTVALKDLSLHRIDFSKIAAIPTLESFECDGCCMSESALAWMPMNPRLTSIGIHGNKRLSANDISYIAKCPRLEYLSLANTNVDDEMISELMRATTLRYLVLDGTAVSDEGVRSLKNLSQLRLLSALNTAMTIVGEVYLQDRILGLAVKR